MNTWQKTVGGQVNVLILGEDQVIRLNPSSRKWELAINGTIVFNGKIRPDLVMSLEKACLFEVYNKLDKLNRKVADHIYSSNGQD